MARRGVGRALIFEEIMGINHNNLRRWEFPKTYEHKNYLTCGIIDR